MIDPSVVEAYNARQTVDLNNIKKMTPGEQDKVIANGNAAEALMRNKDFAQFIHQFKFEICDAMAEIRTHTVEDNATRVCLANQISGIDSFISTLRRAAFFKQRVVSLRKEQNPDADPDLL